MKAVLGTSSSRGSREWGPLLAKAHVSVCMPPSKRRDSSELVGGRSATGTCRARRASLNSLASVESQGVGPAFHPASILPFGLSRLTSIGKETVDPASDFQA